MVNNLFMCRKESNSFPAPSLEGLGQRSLDSHDELYSTPHLALSIVVPQPCSSHFLMRCQSSTNRPVEASLHNRNRQNKNKEQNCVLKLEAVLKFQGKQMAGLGLLVQETSCAYKAGTYEKIGVGTWDKGTVSAILSSQNNILPRGQEASCRGET
ncbi:hypothetical protein mRhiFer1_009449 [Rhinolophus ferrumequinum]|uniref:Uncharacterized protein n=1 Tax=Rhinolophus ferrumequinum TaxID=59479 RepID=A0A7J7RJ91_RHIFE|nr:hypothetical protein mRhiFer1_009449 [Rhinolophus ferrumequinum]